MRMEGVVARLRRVSVDDMLPAILFGAGYFFIQRLSRVLKRYADNWRAAARLPGGKKKAGQKWTGLYVLGFLVSVSLGVQLLCYRRYGPLFFVSAEAKRLSHTSSEWRELLRTRSVAFVGGHHRAGTTMLWRALAAHPSVASFGEQRECGLDFSEGVFAQDVYPRFGVGEAEAADPLALFGLATLGRRRRV